MFDPQSVQSVIQDYTTVAVTAASAVLLVWGNLIGIVERISGDLAKIAFKKS
jgi:hypothetical protein